MFGQNTNAVSVLVHPSSVIDAVMDMVITWREWCLSVWENQGRLHIKAKSETRRMNSVCLEDENMMGSGFLKEEGTFKKYLECLLNG